MTPLEHLRVWLRQRESQASSTVALRSGEEDPRAVVTIGDLRVIETLASAHDGEKAAKNLDAFGALALTAKAARLERENAALLEDAHFHKGQMSEAVAKSEALLLQLQRANDELIKERARADAFFEALNAALKVKP